MSTVNTMRVLFIAPQCEPEELTVVCTPTRLDAMQALVGGLMDRVVLTKYPDGSRLDLWVNDEGLLMELQANLIFRAENRPPLVGNAFVAALNAQGETLGLTDEQVALAQKLLDHHFRRS